MEGDYTSVYTGELIVANKYPRKAPCSSCPLNFNNFIIEEYP